MAIAGDEEDAFIQDHALSSSGLDNEGNVVFAEDGKSAHAQYAKELNKTEQSQISMNSSNLIDLLSVTAVEDKRSFGLEDGEALTVQRDNSSTDLSEIDSSEFADTTPYQENDVCDVGTMRIRGGGTDSIDCDDDPPLVEDPLFSKYFHMLNINLPIPAVKRAMQRDGKDPDVLNLDQSKSFKSQMNSPRKTRASDNPSHHEKEDQEHVKRLTERAQRRAEAEAKYIAQQEAGLAEINRLKIEALEQATLAEEARLKATEKLENTEYGAESITLSKNVEMTAKGNSEFSQVSISPFAGGGLAAASGSKKVEGIAEERVTDEQSSNISGSSPFAGGGIAAAAAARRPKNVVGIVEEGVIDVESFNISGLSPFAGGGIAVAAQAAAEKRSDNSPEKLEFQDIDESPSEGIGMSPFAGGNISAVAAEAARSKTIDEVTNMKAPDEQFNLSALSPFAGGGIAGAAAAAAAARSKSKTLDEAIGPQIDEQYESREVSTSPFAGGGIAAAAAAAAAMRSKKVEVLADEKVIDEESSYTRRSSPEFQDIDKSPSEGIDMSPFAGGNIAAAAAAARSKTIDEVANMKAPEEQSNLSALSPFAGGGIAGAAAAAAAARSKSKTLDEAIEPQIDEQYESREVSISPFAGGGIAAAAAAAAAMRSKKTVGIAEERVIDEVSSNVIGSAPFVGGEIAAAAADAAVKSVRTNEEEQNKRANKESGSEPNSVSSMGGAGKATATTESGLCSFIGGEIAMSAAAATAASFNSDIWEAEPVSIKMPLSSLSERFLEGAAVAVASSKLICVQEELKSRIDDESESNVETIALDANVSKVLPYQPNNGLVSSAAQNYESNVLDIVPELSNDNANYENLRRLRKDIASFSNEDLLNATIRVASQKIATNPRDAATYYNMYALSMLGAAGLPKTNKRGVVATEQTLTVEEGSNVDAAPTLSTDLSCVAADVSTRDAHLARAEKSLSRCLLIADQAMSIGMMGWMEYGSSNVLNRTTERFHDIMSRLSCLYAERDDWESTVDMLRALVLRCEQHLPVYHPLTLSAMLDLAAALIMDSKDIQAKKYVARVSERLACYLAEQEELVLSTYESLLTEPSPNPISFGDLTASKYVSRLKAFVSIFQRLLKRKFIFLIGKTHEIVLLNHCFLGDTLSVLANCLSLTENERISQDSNSTGSRQSEYVWSVAYTHYSFPFKYWTKFGKMHHPNIAHTACAVARCLRELGHRDRAIEVLSAVISTKNDVSPEVSDEAIERSNIFPMISFIPSNKGLKARVCIGKEQSIALCLWSMAVFFAESNPDERGRVRALSLLHATSEALQRAMKVDEENGGSHKDTCIEMLQCVENEARELLQPWQEVVSTKPHLQTIHEQDREKESRKKKTSDTRRKSKEMKQRSSNRNDCYDRPVIV